MKIDWNCIDNFLIGEMNTDNISSDCKKEIETFLPIHDMDVFSEESLEQLGGIWDLAYRSAYEKSVGFKTPNIFYRILKLEDENYSNE